MSALIRRTETAVPASPVIFFAGQIIAAEDTLNESVTFCDLYYFITMIHNSNNNMTLIVRKIIIRIDDPDRIEQSQLIFKA